jgi:hypothetical protein
MPIPPSISPRVALVLPEDAVPPPPAPAPAAPAPLARAQSAVAPVELSHPTQPSMEAVSVPDFTLVR